jgi:hypothetical protein
MAILSLNDRCLEAYRDTTTIVHSSWTHQGWIWKVEAVMARKDISLIRENDLSTPMRSTRLRVAWIGLISFTSSRFKASYTTLRIYACMRPSLYAYALINEINTSPVSLANGFHDSPGDDLLFSSVQLLNADFFIDYSGLAIVTWPFESNELDPNQISDDLCVNSNV